VSTQVAFLDGTLRVGAGATMQGLFPEGDLFTHVLTGLAAAALARPESGLTDSDRAAHLQIARRMLGEVESERNRGLFAGTEHPPGGAFLLGWRLLLVAEIGRASGLREDRSMASAGATQVAKAFGDSEGILLESYPGRAWPCDNVVAWAAAIRAGDLTGLNLRPAARDWLTRASALRDPATGLLVHEAGLDGRVLSGPRGSSQSIIQTFLPDLDPSAALQDWAAYRRWFVVRVAGLIGVREFPTGTSGAGDVDSGPLLWGVSASSSAVTLAAARANGDRLLADSLDREAELLGVGFSWGGTRRYAAGALPVGDAFLAWGRSLPLGGASFDTDDSSPGQPWWALLVALAFAPAVAVGAWWHRRRHGTS